ncbi:MAG: hypothetical protein BYD32DRAFT_419724 [Podila humilis]|nr:MAG: hypothetical protein BYD32DRAFT_419724 [Podila humilis]
MIQRIQSAGMNAWLQNSVVRYPAVFGAPPLFSLYPSILICCSSSLLFFCHSILFSVAPQSSPVPLLQSILIGVFPWLSLGVLACCRI